MRLILLSIILALPATGCVTKAALREAEEMAYVRGASEERKMRENIESGLESGLKAYRLSLSECNSRLDQCLNAGTDK